MGNKLTTSKVNKAVNVQKKSGTLKSAERPEILFVTSFPPRECGIATYSEDLIKALNNKFGKSFKIRICALENEYENHQYPKEVKYVLNTQESRAFKSLAGIINLDDRTKMVVFQHEFGFYANNPTDFTNLLKDIQKTKIVVFHTVLPNANEQLKENVKLIAEHTDKIIVMTQTSAKILNAEYAIDNEKINVIAHGTHLVTHRDKTSLKKKYGLEDKKILSTFGLLSSGKSIETTLDALPDVVKTKPDVLFLILGKTHPGIIKQEGEKYRNFLESKVKDLKLEQNVRFVNKYLPLEELLDYLQLTDIYLFTSKDPNQAVSGTFSYAASCGCAIVSTPIPHAVEFLSGNSGIIVDFQNSQKLGEAINKLLFDVKLRKTVKTNALHKIVATAWENTALQHAALFEQLSEGSISLSYKKPIFNLQHIKKMTTQFGMIQFAKINHPDINSGYTLDDNARALIAMCQYYELSKDEKAIKYIRIYLDFIAFCQQADGTFLNYVSSKHIFTEENQNCNLQDANGRAIWALGYMIFAGRVLPKEIKSQAEMIIERAMVNIEGVHSPRAMSFIIKGLYYYNVSNKSKAVRLLVRKLADRLTQMYLHESSKDWLWFESYLTYANSTLPEALIYAYMETNEEMYKEVAKTTFNFLLSETFTKDLEIKVISNKNWYTRGGEKPHFGEQPIDVAYTIFALNTFYKLFKDESYRLKMESAFEWFLGRNHLKQIIYNPCTGGCYDGLEENTINLNQGAESTVSFLLASLCMEKSKQLLNIRETKRSKLKPQNYSFNV